MLNVVLDTNIVLVSVSSHSPFHWVFQSLIEGKYSASVTSDILFEYEEVLAEEMGISLAESAIETFDNLPNVQFVSEYFRWQLISADEDDNKFADCAIASNADYIVTEDKHFNVLKRIKFPKVNVINLNQFKKLFNQ
ncbi:MAG: putative toxin-antitoxin system toxin component, PIN family [Ignavibacteriales bacterium]|nr:putative toxin-antitoxin system toxin component, PIN family [Ignavibacteriales bacterium]